MVLKFEMKNKNLKTFEDEYIVKFKFKNKNTGFFEQKEESVWAFGKEAHKKVEKKIINKYRGIGIKIEVISVTYV